MIVEQIDDSLFVDYTNVITKKLHERINFINESLSDLYSGKAFFQYNINEEVLINTLKNDYEINAE